MKNQRFYFSGFDVLLWLSSVVLILVSFLLFDRTNHLTLIASLIGVTSLILSAKGNPTGRSLYFGHGLLRSLPVQRRLRIFQLAENEKKAGGVVAAYPFINKTAGALPCGFVYGRGDKIQELSFAPACSFNCKPSKRKAINCFAIEKLKSISLNEKRKEAPCGTSFLFWSR